MAEKKEVYADAFFKEWQKYMETSHFPEENDAMGYMMTTLVLAHIADELADLKAILSQKGDK